MLTVERLPGVDFVRHHDGEGIAPKVPHSTISGQRFTDVVSDRDRTLYYLNNGCGSSRPSLLRRAELFDTFWSEAETLLTWPDIACPRSLTLSPDGSLYILDSNKILRRWPDGRLEIVFEGSRADRLVVAPDGALVFSQSSHHRVLRFGPDGQLTTIAGTGSLGFSGDGGPAVDAQLRNPNGLAYDRQGRLIIADRGNNRLRRVSGGGIIETIAGGAPSSFAPVPIGTPALAGFLLGPGDLAVGPDDTIYVATFNGVQTIRPPLPGFEDAGYTIASSGGERAFLFDDSGRHLRTVSALDGSTRLGFEYDDRGDLIGAVDADGNRTRIERDADGEPIAVVGPFGARTELVVDGEGFLREVRNPAGESTILEYAAGGLLSRLERPGGREQTFRYSELGRLVEEVGPLGDEKVIERRLHKGGYTVDLSTGLGRTTTYGLTRLVDGSLLRFVTSPAGLTTTTVEMADGRTVVTDPTGARVVSQQGPDPRWGMVAPTGTSTEVVLPSGLTRLSEHTRAAVLQHFAGPFAVRKLNETKEVNGRRFTVSYDGTAREFVAVSPEGRRQVTRIDSQGRTIAVEQAGHEPTSFAYDPQGRLTEVREGSGDRERVSRYSYDSRGRLASWSDPLERRFEYEYDDADRLTRQILPDGGAISFTYGDDGRLASIVPPGRAAHLFRHTAADAIERYEPPELYLSPSATTYTYDLDGKLVNVTRPDGKSLIVTYDEAGRTQALSHPAGEAIFAFQSETGQLATVTAGDTAITYTYDGPLLTATSWSGAVEGTVERTYDANFWLRTTSVLGADVGFDYDDDGLVTRAGQLAIARDALTGSVVGTSLGAVETNLSFDSFGDLESFRAAVGGVDLYAAGYLRDRLGRIVTKTETVGGTTQVFDYSYDVAGRLERIDRQGAVVEQYRYDTNGNRLAATYSWGEREGVYDGQDRLLSNGDETLTYTAAGELSTRTVGGATTRHEYDVLGNLRRVELATGGVVEYVIDGRNRRVGRKIDGVLVQGFLYRDALNPIAELDGAGNLVSRFVYGTRPNVPDYLVRADGTYRLISDHLGSVRLVVDVTTGAIAQRIDYDGFGRTLLDTAPGFQPFGFAGGLYDPVTGLVRFGARDYDPQVGRWTAKDPVGFAGGSGSLYAYALNDAINRFDPTGLEVQICQRPNEIPQFEGVPVLDNLPHLWLKTDEKTGGLGEAGGGVPGDQLPGCRCQATEIVDHADEMDQPGVTCQTVPLVDEDCVNRQLEIGEPRGNWLPLLNDCWSFVRTVINECRHNPGRPGYRQSPL